MQDISCALPSHSNAFQGKGLNIILT